MDFMTRFGEMIEEKHLKQSEVAEALGISKQAVNKLKNGGGLPSLDLFYKICTFFQVSADYMLGLTEDKNYKRPLTKPQDSDQKLG